ncbi:MAG: efflux transporter outer membrane subunit [Alphaproteobacteria bacterium]|nr:efflux transporter outer membrane subunit [Alphaproteobacteria bacterium]
MLKSTSALAPAVGATLASLALASCVSAGPNFKAPAAPTVAGYAMSDEDAAPGVSFAPEHRAAGAWWRALGSSELDTLVRQALKDSPDIALAEANLRAAEATFRSRTGDRSFTVDGLGSAQRERINTQSFGFQGFPSPTINLYQIGVSTSYDFDIFGRKRRAAEAAKARAEAEARRADAAYLSLTASASLQAVRIATLRGQIASVQQTISGDELILDMIKRAQAAGGAPRSATSIGDAQLAADQALLPPLKRQLAEARHQLALLLGKSPAEWSAPDFDLTDFSAPGDIPVVIPSELVRRRPDILAAEAEAHAATADIGVATADLYPNLNLTASLTQGSIEPGDLFKYASSGWSVAAGLTAPIFHGGKLRAERDRVVAVADADMARYRQTVLHAFVEVSDALAGLATDQQALDAQTRAEETARANVDDTTRAYQLGAGTLLDVFDARRQLNIALRGRVTAEGQKLADIIALFAATGSDWR